MKKVSREYAKTQLSLYEIFHSTEKELIDILNADYIYRTGKHEGENIPYQSLYDKPVFKFLVKYFNEIVIKGVSNSYLTQILKKSIEDEIEIVGNPEKMYECSCCGYLTLSNRAEYDICRLCGWEDDGTPTSEYEKYSSVNGCTLQEAKNKFLKSFHKKKIIFDKAI